MILKIFIIIGGKMFQKKAISEIIKKNLDLIRGKYIKRRLVVLIILGNNYLNNMKINKQIMIIFNIKD